MELSPRGGVRDEGRIKLLVLGDSGVGKTSLVHVLCAGRCLRPVFTVQSDTAFSWQERRCEILNGRLAVKYVLVVLTAHTKS